MLKANKLMLDQDYFDLKKKLESLNESIELTILREITYEPSKGELVTEPEVVVLPKVYTTDTIKIISELLEIKVKFINDYYEICDVVSISKPEDRYSIDTKDIKCKVPTLNLRLDLIRYDYAGNMYRNVIVITTIINSTKFTLVDERIDFNVMKDQFYNMYIKTRVLNLLNEYDSKKGFYTANVFNNNLTIKSAFENKLDTYITRYRTIKGLFDITHCKRFVGEYDFHIYDDKYKQACFMNCIDDDIVYFFACTLREENIYEKSIVRVVILNDKFALVKQEYYVMSERLEIHSVSCLIDDVIEMERKHKCDCVNDRANEKEINNTPILLQSLLKSKEMFRFRSLIGTDIFNTYMNEMLQALYKVDLDCRFKHFLNYIKIEPSKIPALTGLEDILSSAKSVQYCNDALLQGNIGNCTIVVYNIFNLIYKGEYIESKRVGRALPLCGLKVKGIEIKDIVEKNRNMFY